MDLPKISGNIDAKPEWNEFRPQGRDEKYANELEEKNVESAY